MHATLFLDTIFEAVIFRVNSEWEKIQELADWLDVCPGGGSSGNVFIERVMRFFRGDFSKTITMTRRMTV